MCRFSLLYHLRFRREQVSISHVPLPRKYGWVRVDNRTGDTRVRSLIIKVAFLKKKFIRRVHKRLHPLSLCNFALIFLSITDDSIHANFWSCLLLHHHDERRGGGGRGGGSSIPFLSSRGSRILGQSKILTLMVFRLIFFTVIVRPGSRRWKSYFPLLPECNLLLYRKKAGLRSHGFYAFPR